MGNAESSSETTPSRKYDDDDDYDESIRRRSLRQQAKKETDEGESSTQFSSVLKVGAAVAGGLLALGALSLTSSSSPSGEVEAHVKRNVNSNHREIKIMSYNVWFGDVKMEERMEAIGNLVEQYSPDIIFFQEVTPDIYELFESSSWWQLYKPSVSSDDAANRIIYFCMLLSKLTVKKFMSKPFENSSMGRELCAAEIDVGLNKTLIVATSHLESLPQNSGKRVSQAKEALRLLQQFPNVIFGGDMNWDENKDDDFPLGGDWTDAWAELRGEPGWTYDTKSNTMLQGHKPILQKRLDRFICKLEDFRMMNVEMIGKEAIPGLSYRNKKGMVLPVFPSDHYGLILTIYGNV